MEIQILDDVDYRYIIFIDGSYYVKVSDESKLIETYNNIETTNRSVTILDIELKKYVKIVE